ncbi:DUF2514 family protein [Burkholderia aenigmatica]|uniref:DUF2514 domain-containing protein n=1 Tax=Burkholderia aenigmatica TaxID=2015348 RepID=A0A228IBD6_9BURK|nr:DUF2514 family protein [Burkholderia aenigmatica]OXI39626.1 hypothetical protein CFB84_25100 [Burkholderia aenigmatica]
MTWFDPRFWLVVIVAMFVGVAAGYSKGHRDADQSHTVETQAQRIRDLVVERDESDRIARQQQGNAEDASKKRDQARADAARAAIAADGLRNHVAELIGREHDSAASAGGSATGGALDLLADMLGRADARAGELAAIADERGIAGRQCQADYDALKFTSDKIPN